MKIATINDLNDPFELLGPTSKDQKVRRQFRKLKEQLASNRGMLCFSRHWHNPVQWSHYSDRHRGLCLGFDIPDEHLTQVIYRSKRFEPDLAALGGSGKSAQKEVLKILSTKYSHWRYENEWRCFLKLDEVDRETGLYFAQFSRDLELREIIVGYTSTIARGELRDALADTVSSVKLYKARLAFRSFRVVRQQKESLWT